MSLNVIVVDGTNDRRAAALAAAVREAGHAVWVCSRQLLYRYPDDHLPAACPAKLDLVLVHNNDRALWTKLEREHQLRPVALVNYSGAAPDRSTADALWIQKKVGSDGLPNADIGDVTAWVDANCHPGLVPEILGGASNDLALLELLSTLQAFVWLSELHGPNDAKRLIEERAVRNQTLGVGVIAEVVARHLAKLDDASDATTQYVHARLDAVVRERSAVGVGGASVANFTDVPDSVADVVRIFRGGGDTNDLITFLAALRDVMLSTRG